MASAEPAKDLFQVRTELYAPSRLPPKALELHRTRALVTDVVAQQCWLYVLAIAKLQRDLHDTNSDGHGSAPRVGIIGGGHVGCAVAMVLLAHHYPPHKILLSTRQPEKLPKCDALASPSSQTRFQQIPRVYDNARVSRESDVLVLCVPPSQLKSVAIQIKHTACVVVSVLAGTSVETLQKACGTKLVLRTVIDVQRLSAAFVRYEDAQQGDEEADTVANDEGVHDKALVALRQRAEALAAAHLTTQFGDEWMASPLARVLGDLTCRVDRALPPSRVEETVAAVLIGDKCSDDATLATSPRDDTMASVVHGSPETADDPLPVAQEGGRDTASIGVTSDPHQEDDEAEPRWLAAWTSSLQQLQRAAATASSSSRG